MIDDHGVSVVIPYHVHQWDTVDVVVAPSSQDGPLGYSYHGIIGVVNVDSLFIIDGDAVCVCTFAVC